MAGKAKDNGKDAGGAVVEIKVPMITLTFDPRTCQIAMSGYCPTHEFCKALLLAAADEEERIIQRERNEQRIALATADALRHLPTRPT